MANTAKDLRSALLPWILISFLLAAVAYLAALRISDELTSDALSALASSLISVGVALLITEYVLKPVYLRDVLKVARLKEEIHQSGIDSVQRLSQARLNDLVVHSSSITICATNAMAQRLWPDVLESAATKATDVRLFLIDPDSEMSRQFELSWKEKSCEDRGSSLLISQSSDSMPILTIDTEARCAVAISDGSSSSGNPLIVQFTKTQPDPYVRVLSQFVDQIRNSDAVPYYMSKAKP